MRELNSTELNSTELNRVVGGGGIILGGDAEIPLGGGGRIGGSESVGGSSVAPLPFMGIGPGGRDWWIVPGDLNPIIPVPKPEPGKP